MGRIKFLPSIADFQIGNPGLNLSAPETGAERLLSILQRGTNAARGNESVRNGETELQLLSSCPAHQREPAATRLPQLLLYSGGGGGVVTPWYKK